MVDRVKQLDTRDIHVDPGHRPLHKKRLHTLADSMSQIGLQTPITVRKGNRGWVLVAGHHRLRAAKSLGWEKIDCVVMRDDKLDSALWRIAENLHRAGLTKLERADQFKKWKQLIAKKQKAVRPAPPGGRQPHDKGLRKVADQLGTTREDIRRADAVSRLSNKAKRKAQELGLDNNQTALLQAAKESTPTKQVEVLANIAQRKVDRKRRASAVKGASAPGRDFETITLSASAKVGEQIRSLATGRRARLTIEKFEPRNDAIARAHTVKPIWGFGVPKAKRSQASKKKVKKVW